MFTKHLNNRWHVYKSRGHNRHLLATFKTKEEAIKYIEESRNDYARRSK